MAEKVAVAARSVIAVPDGVELAEAAGILVAHGTSHDALKDRGELAEGETLIVLGGAGGVGLAAVELGAAMGARVIAAASTDEKLELCRERGAHEVINDATDDLRGSRSATARTSPSCSPGGGRAGSSRRCPRPTRWNGRARRPRTWAKRRAKGKIVVTP